MANQYVQVPTDGSGKKVQTFENTIGGQVVQSQGVVLVNSAGTPIDSPTSAVGLPVTGNKASGAADSGEPVKIGGVYNTGLITLATGQRGDLQMDAAGQTRVISAQGHSQKRTYSAVVSGLAVIAGATDIWEFIGPSTANKVAVIHKIYLDLFFSSFTNSSILLAKRSSAATGGTTGTAPTAVPHDSSDTSASASIKTYTAAPTLGSLVGYIRILNWTFGGGSLTGLRHEWDFGWSLGKGIRLYDNTQTLCVNIASFLITDPVIAISCEWTEEDV